jgi:hypothetical protein
MGEYIMRFNGKQGTTGMKGASRTKLSVFGLIVTAMLTACSSTTEPSVETETVEVEREEITVHPESIQLNKELEQLEVVLTTNLPAETIVDVTLSDAEGRYWGSEFDAIVDSEGKIHSEITPSYDSIAINGEYQVEVEVTVNGDDDDETENINEDFLFDSTLGGFADDMEEYYEGSEVVEVSTEEYNSSNYVLNVSSASTVSLSNGYTEEEVAQMEAEKEAETASTSDTTEEDTTDTESTYESTDSYGSGQSEYASATGNDWLEYSFDEKFIAVQTIINAMEASGTTVSADVYWFIDALNGYYFGNDAAGTSEKILDIMTLSGVAGGVIQ